MTLDLNNLRFSMASIENVPVCCWTTQSDTIYICDHDLFELDVTKTIVHEIIEREVWKIVSEWGFEKELDRALLYSKIFDGGVGHELCPFIPGMCYNFDCRPPRRVRAKP